MSRTEAQTHCWRWWFEMAPPPDGQAGVAEEPRLERLAALLLDPRGHESEFLALERECEAAGDLESQAVAIVGGITSICNGGRQFSTLGQWIDRADALLLHANTPSPEARASLLLHTIIAALLGPTHIPTLRLRVARLGEMVEIADSDPLRIAHAAVAAYAEALGGQLHAARENIADALHLCPDPEAAVLPKFHLLSSLGLIQTLQGDPVSAGAGLDRLLAHPLFDALPLPLWLLCLCHRLLAMAMGGASPSLDSLAERIRNRVIPEHNAYLQSYLHYSLGVASLFDRRPQHALDHGRRAMRLGLQCASIPGEAVPALLVGQALADLGEEDAALAQFSCWLPRWQANGFMLLYAAGLLEQANLLSRNGHVGEARQTLMLAHRVLPAHEPLPAYHRSRTFGEELEATLLPAPAPPPFATDHPTPIAITGFGGLIVRLGDNVIYDRDWRGDRTKALLKALIVLGGQKVSAEQLCDLLWPDSEGIQSRQNLKVATWRLRRLGLEKGQDALPWLVVERGQYSLVHALCRVDSHQFILGLQKAQSCGEDISLLTAALDLYRGDFLPRDDSHPWIVAYREMLRHRYLTATHTLARRAIASNQTDLALPYLDHAVDIDPSDERSSEFRIRILLAQGYPGEALRAYHQLEAALQARHGIAPGHAITNLIAPLFNVKVS